MAKMSKLPKKPGADTDRLPEMWNRPTTAVPPLPALLEACRPTGVSQEIAPTKALPVSRRDLDRALGQLSRDLSDQLHEVRAPLYPEPTVSMPVPLPAPSPAPVQALPPMRVPPPIPPPAVRPPPLIHPLPPQPPPPHLFQPPPHLVGPAPAAPARKKPRPASHSNNELLIYELRQTRWVILLLLIAVIIAAGVGVGLLMMSFLPRP